MTYYSDKKIKPAGEAKDHKRNVSIYFALLFLSLVYVYFSGGFFPYSILYLTLSLPVMSACHLVLVCHFLRINESLNEKVFNKGDCATYKLYLKNGSFLYIPYITIQMHMEGQIICKDLKSMRLALNPFSDCEFHYHIPLLYRGSYDIGVKNVKIQDVLGLFSVTIHQPETKSILIRPRIIETSYENADSARSSEGSPRTNLKGSGNDEVTNIRDYAHGDSFRKIHWKLTSKLGKVMVKETRTELDNDIIIILNLQSQGAMDEDTLLKEDCIIEELLSLTNFLVKNKIPVRFYASGNEPLMLRASNEAGFFGIYQFLSEVKFNQTQSFGQILELFSDNEQKGKMICIFTICLDADIVSKSLHLRNKGLDVEIYYLMLKGKGNYNSPAYRELTEMLIKNDIRSYKLEPERMPAFRFNFVSGSSEEKTVTSYEA